MLDDFGVSRFELPSLFNDPLLSLPAVHVVFFSAWVGVVGVTAFQYSLRNQQSYEFSIKKLDAQIRAQTSRYKQGSDLRAP